MAQCIPVSAGQVMGNLGKIKTPLVASAWAKALEQHPDRDFVEFVMNGIVQGFRIGFDYHTHKCQPAKQNIISAKKNPLIVAEYLGRQDGWWAHSPRKVCLVHRLAPLVLFLNPTSQGNGILY